MMEGGRLCGQARARDARRLRDVRRSLWTGILGGWGLRDDLEGHWNLSVAGRGDSGHARHPGTEERDGGHK